MPVIKGCDGVVGRRSLVRQSTMMAVFWWQVRVHGAEMGCSLFFVVAVVVLVVLLK